MKTYTRKLFYKSYPYKVELIAFRTPAEANLQIKRYLERYTEDCDADYLATIRQSRDYHRTAMAHRVAPTDVRAYFSIFVPYLYFKTPEMYEQFCAYYSDRVVNQVEPYSEAHMVALQGKENTEFRKKLLYNRYRFTVHFNPWRRHGFEGKILHDRFLDEWFPHYCQTAELVQGQDWRLKDKWGKAIHFRRFDDVIMVKMKASEIIDRIEEIQLISEINHEQNYQEANHAGAVN